MRGSSSEEAGSVMCVIRRCEDASAALLPVGGAGAGTTGPPAIAHHHPDHIVFRLDSNFNILCMYLTSSSDRSSVVDRALDLPSYSMLIVSFLFQLVI